jgi:hypothetical protein
MRKLRSDPWLSAREARELVFCFIRWGEHRDDHLRRLPDAAVESELSARGYSLTATIEELQRNPHRAISHFENLLEGGTWEISASPGVEVKHSFMVDGVTFAEKVIKGHAIVRQSYKAEFTAACEARDAAIANSNFDSFYTALSKGFASLEAYFTLKVAVHNNKCTPADRLEEKRPKGGFVSLDTKIQRWLPMLTGVSVDVTTSPGWNDFLYLRKLRNDVVIHPKPDAGLSTLEELADGINRFRSGIGSLMFMLHQAFREPMQSSIIRAMHYPTVRVLGVVGEKGDDARKTGVHEL